jgi:hypothetical protein
MATIDASLDELTGATIIITATIISTTEVLAHSRANSELFREQSGNLCLSKTVWWGWEGKNTLHLVGLDDQGTIVLREKLARSRIRTRLANVPRCLIGIEAGIGTHYVAHELIALGHDVRQVPPVYARPFRQTHKNDFRDAYAIAEAVRRPSTRCAPVKTDDGQCDLTAKRVAFQTISQPHLRVCRTGRRTDYRS